MTVKNPMDELNNWNVIHIEDFGLEDKAEIINITLKTAGFDSERRGAMVLVKKEVSSIHCDTVNGILGLFDKERSPILYLTKDALYVPKTRFKITHNGDVSLTVESDIILIFAKSKVLEGVGGA